MRYLSHLSTYRSFYSPIPQFLTISSSSLTISSSHPNRFASTQTNILKPTKTVISSSDQPAYAVDSNGARIPPLSPYVDPLASIRRQTKTTPSKLENGVQTKISETMRGDDDSYEAAVQSGSIPDSGLARVIFDTWKRFPDCIVLTRVGKFYESYYAPAFDVASLLSLKLAYRKYKSGSYPFAGFPIPQLEKYLKILVHDLGRTVVLLEEYDEEGNRRDGTVNVSESINRKVGRVVTPGTLDESWFAGDESRYLLSIALPMIPISTSPEDQRTVKNLENSFDSPTFPNVALAYADISTGEFFTKDATLAQMEDELARLAPREIVLDSTWRTAWENNTPAAPQIIEFFDLLRVLRVHVSFANLFSNPDSTNISPLQFQEATVLHTTPTSIPPPLSSELLAITLLRKHLEYALRDTMPSIPAFNRQSSKSFMQIDAATLQALEIRHTLRPGGLVTGPTSQSSSSTSLSTTKGSLLSVLSRTITSSGNRLLVRTLTAPSTSLPLINARLALVQSFVERESLRTDTRDALKGFIDVMRVIQHFKQREGTPRDIWEVGQWIRGVERILTGIQQDIGRSGRKKKANIEIGEQSEGAERLREVVDGFKELSDLAKKIEESIDESALMRVSEEMAFEEENEEGILRGSGRKEVQTKREGREQERDEKEDAMLWLKPSFSLELKALHNKLAALRSEREEMQRALREKHKISSLVLQRGSKAGWVIGVDKKAEYDNLSKKRDFQSISVSSKTLSYGPWSTLGNRLEETIEKLSLAQRRAFDQLRTIIVSHSEKIQHNSELVDELDLCMSFAQTAVELNYVRPILTTGTELHIINGRHPSVESGLLTSARTFIPNSTHMNPQSYLHIITGPNQGGKSTLLRQTAIIAILAQSGSFVPADKAVIGIVDRVFSRVGARDDLSRDRGTFMLEMVETAGILKYATRRSLVIMDEIGRGTTLNAGISIAYATLDHLINDIKCRTLFATHYHELVDMLTTINSEGQETTREGVSYFCTDVIEASGAFSYSYRLQPGVNRNSHAIKAAQLAGMPESFLETARRTLESLQKKSLTGSIPNLIASKCT